MKRILNVEDEWDFSLIGLGCHAKDYRLSWELNKALRIDLSKESRETQNPEHYDEPHTSARYFNEETHLEFTLISNKNNGKLLIPEHPQLDYFIKIEGPQHEVEAEECTALLRDIDLILALVTINPDRLKSRKKLLF